MPLSGPLANMPVSLQKPWHFVPLLEDITARRSRQRNEMRGHSLNRGAKRRIEIIAEREEMGWGWHEERALGARWSEACYSRELVTQLPFLSLLSRDLTWRPCRRPWRSETRPRHVVGRRESCGIRSARAFGCLRLP